MSQRVVTSLNLSKTELLIGGILVKGRKRKENTDHFGDKKENEREY